MGFVVMMILLALPAASPGVIYRFLVARMIVRQLALYRHPDAICGTKVP
jgi:hypothetical protein